MKTNKKIIISIFALTFTGFISTAVFADAKADADITTAVNHKLETHPTVSGVTASTNDGVVTLTGHLKSDSDVSLAVEKAESTPGVTDVNSNLTVEGSTQPLTDTVTTAKVKGTFIREKLFGDKDLAAMMTSVETKDGAVILTGNADNQAQIDNATALAKKVGGVKSVENKMEIKTVSN